jgi:hypothetical protein
MWGVDIDMYNINALYYNGKNEIIYSGDQEGIMKITWIEDE